jgi:tetratricopeptide (TPR) repeat protein
MFSSSSGESSALQTQIAQRSFYQQLIYSLLSRSIHTTEGFQLLGRQLADISHHAYFLRQIETVDQASQLMLALPISNELKGIAHYYQAICSKRKGDIDEAFRLLERALEEASPNYKARALLTIGSIYLEHGKTEESLSFYLTAAQAARSCDLLTLAQSQWNLAIVRSIYGDHKRTLDDLEHLFPLVRAISKGYPTIYYDFLNGLAVELGEVGRVNEAQAICAITLASPFAQAYPEWSETRDELEAKSARATPSIVAVSISPEPSSQTRLASKANPMRALATNRSARAKILFQRSILLIVADVAIALVGAIQIILDRARHSIIPRGPPAHFQF